MKFLYKSTLILLIGLLVGGVLGYQAGLSGVGAKLNKFPPAITVYNKESQSSQSVDFAKYWQVWDILVKDHIFRNDVQASDLLAGSLKGLASSFNDPYTTYLDVEQNEALTESIEGKFEGIGAELGMENDIVVVVSPLEGSPAEASGLKPQDKIIAVDGNDVFGMNLQEVVNIIRGPKGTEVILTVIREGAKETIEIKIIRDEIKIDSVRWEDKGNGIFYIRISRFGTNTNLEWNNAIDNALNTIGKDSLKGIVIDVRSNPGGVLNSAVYIANEFVKKDQPIIWQANARGDEVAYKTTRDPRINPNRVNVVVLINEGSASASEILAGALRDHLGATLVGRKSFGKGTIQESIQLGDSDALNVTIAKWLTPSKQWVNETKGLEPDIDIEIPEDYKVGDVDPQLEAAINEASKSFEFNFSGVIDNLSIF